MRKWYLLLAGGAGVAAIVAAVVFLLRVWPAHPEAGAGVPVVEVAAVRKGKLSSSGALSGKVVPAAEVQLAPKVAGKVASVNVRVGDRVRRGQVLLTLEGRELAAAVEQAEAALAAARAAADQARFERDRAAAVLAQAEESFRIAKENLARGEFLRAQGAISQADFEARFETPYINAEAGLKQARSAFEAATHRLEVVAPAQVAQAEAALKLARANYENTVLTSPLDGVVAARNIDPGEFVTPGVPVLTLVDLSSVSVEAWAQERQVGLLRVGKAVTVRLPALGLTARGVVAEVSPAADARTKAYLVKVRLPNAGGRLRPGMFAEVLLPGGPEQLLVPAAALVAREGRWGVFVVSGGRLSFRSVVPGDSDGRLTAVRGGLKEGELVVVSGKQGLSPGMRVKAVQAV